MGRFCSIYLKQACNWAEDDANIFCPFHGEVKGQSKSPSLSVSRSGKYRCHSSGCEARGPDVSSMYSRLLDIPVEEATEMLYGRHVETTIADSEWESCATRLTHHNAAKAFLRKKRGLTPKTIRQFRLGFERGRVIIPVFNEHGACVNFRRYRWSSETAKGPKMLPYKKGYGSPARLFPLPEFLRRPSDDPVLLVEGEPDVMLAWQLGYTALTVTGGKAWSNKFTRRLAGREVWICYDVNDKDDGGQKTARTRAMVLAGAGCKVKIVILPLKIKGGDLTDYLVTTGHSIGALKKLIASTPYFVQVDKDSALVADCPPTHIDLWEATRGELFHQPVTMDCLAIGKDLSPYLPPRRVRISCSGGRSRCRTCPMYTSDFVIELTIEPERAPQILRLFKTTEKAAQRCLLQSAGIPDNCTEATVDIIETQSVEEVLLIPALDTGAQGEHRYCLRQAFFIGHGLEPNRSYRLSGYLTPTPKYQQAVHIVTEATGIRGTVEEFQMTRSLKQDLKVFQTNDIDRFLGSYYNIMAHNVTRIFKRTDLHMAVDLVFHSVLQFPFAGELIPKGWLEVLILGDTRTGKGFVTEGLARYYGLGEVVSGENCSFAGLVGGLQQMNDRWMITWGKIPINDKRLVVIDEVSALPTDSIARMSRVRSEGVAEIAKIQAAKTHARTRLIWCGNPRGHRGRSRPLAEYSAGVEAVQELMGNLEDVSRLDYALTVAGYEVPSGEINKARTRRPKNPYTKELCRSLILWAWSRQPDQVQFTAKATDAVLQAAEDFGRRYSPIIPLVQVETIRIKIARIAVAVAARTFRTDKTGEVVVVDEQCVRTATAFLDHCYNKPSMAYHVFSRTAIDRATLKDRKELDIVMEGTCGQHLLDAVEGFLESAQLTLMSVCDFIGQDRESAKAFIGELVRQRAIIKRYTFYVKRPAFVEYLRQKRSRLLKGE